MRAARARLHRVMDDPRAMGRLSCGCRDRCRPGWSHPGAGLSEPGHTLHLRLPGRQRRGRAGAIFRREGARCRQPHRHRREQGRGRRQYRGRRTRARAKPDGHTVYVHAASAIAANMHLFKKPPIDAAKDLQIAAGVNKQPFMVMVAGGEPVQDAGRVDRGDEAEGRQGELRPVEHQRQGHGRTLQAGDRRQGGGGPLSDRERQPQRLRRRPSSTTA